jgi:hypothetical protein
MVTIGSRVLIILMCDSKAGLMLKLSDGGGNSISIRFLLSNLKLIVGDVALGDPNAIEKFLARASTVPVANFARAWRRFKQVRNLGAQGSHPGSSPNVDYFALGGLDVKVSERPDRSNTVAWLEAESVARTHAGGTILPVRRSSNAHIEFEKTLSDRVTGKRIIVAASVLGITRNKIEDVLMFPDSAEEFRNIEIAKAEWIRRREYRAGCNRRA